MSAPAPSRDAVVAGQRGTLNIDPKVVEKIAATAAVEIDHVGGAARRVLTLAIGSDDNAERPRVHAEVDGGLVTLDVRCSIAYPAPVATVTQKLRAHLTARIAELTALEVRQVDITVAALTLPSGSSSDPARELL